MCVSDENDGLPALFNRHRIHVVVGHYGSGKTEFALNLARALKTHHERVALVDLDIVNPFFRSAEKGDWLQTQGIELIAPPYALTAVDVPALSADVQRVFDDTSITAVLDVGGDAAGAAALGRFKPYFDRTGCQTYYIVNPYRPYSATQAQIVDLMRLIATRARRAPDYLVNNANLAQCTTVDEILAGQRILQSVAKETNVPIGCVTGERRVLQQLPDLGVALFPIERMLVPEWLET